MVRFGQPVRKGNFRPVARISKDVKRPFDIAGPHHQIEILGVPDHPGICAQAKGSAYEEGLRPPCSEVASIRGRNHLGRDRMTSHPASSGAEAWLRDSTSENHTLTKPLRIAAVGDLHYTKHSKGKAEKLFAGISAAADVAVLCGDLTDYGQPEEAALLAADIQAHLRVPVLAVIGNHDFESGHAEVIAATLDAAGVHMLEDEVYEMRGVGFAGVCGFGGGFGRWMLSSWGEPIVKAFVQEAVDQALRLERRSRACNRQKKIAVLHYAPIRDTVVGENEEIFPFLGSVVSKGRSIVSLCRRRFTDTLMPEHCKARRRPHPGIQCLAAFGARQPGKLPFCLFEVKA